MGRSRRGMRPCGSPHAGEHIRGVPSDLGLATTYRATTRVCRRRVAGREPAPGMALLRAAQGRPDAAWRESGLPWSPATRRRAASRLPA